MTALVAALLLAAAPAPAPKVLRFSPRPNRAAEIHWRAFGPAAFDEAKRSGKPLFLNLAAVWCHWCHVFDETTLSDPKVIALLNGKFVPMRVDADQNPQVERRYLLGGWPSNAFLDEKGEVLGGGTYIPPARFLQLAQKVVDGYAGDRAQLRAALGNVEAPLERETAPGALDADLPTRVGSELRSELDREHGGFGGAPKFPQGRALSLLAYLDQTRADGAALNDAVFTLQRMAQSELFDPVEGGFFRYATRADWGAPHYEKMLAGNAELLLAYADAYAARRDESLREPALSIASYLASRFWSEKGAFWASQDADEQYYKLDAAGRAQLAPPVVDRTFLADRLGLTARALLRAAEVFEEPELARRAAQTEDFVLAKMRAPGGGVFHALADAPNAQPSLPGALADQAETALALQELAAYTGEAKYLRAAGEVLGAAQRALADPSGGFFDVPADPTAAGRVATRVKPFDDNALIAWALIRQGELSGDEALVQRGRDTLAAFAGAAHGLGAADFARAVDAANGQLLRVLVVGPARDAATVALRRAALDFLDPRSLVRVLDAGPHGARLGALTFPAGPPAVYACARETCSRPLRDPAKLAEALRDFASERLK